MERLYCVTHTGDRKWVVSVHGKEIMVCVRKCDAVNAVKVATQLMQRITPAASFRLTTAR